MVGRSWGMVGPWLELVRVPPSGTWEKRRAHLFQTAESWVGPEDAAEPDAREHLVRRYLAAFGPASRKDIARWSHLRPGDLAPVLERLQLRRFRDEAAESCSTCRVRRCRIPRRPLPCASSRPGTPSCSSMRVARGVLPEEYRPRIFSTKMPQSVGTFLVDGAVAGTWRYADGRVAGRVRAARSSHDARGRRRRPSASPRFTASSSAAKNARQHLRCTEARHACTYDPISDEHPHVSTQSSSSPIGTVRSGTSRISRVVMLFAVIVPLVGAGARDGDAVGTRLPVDRRRAARGPLRALRVRHDDRLPPLLHAQGLRGASAGEGHARDPRLHDDAGADHPVGHRSPEAPRALGPARRPAFAARRVTATGSGARPRLLARARRLDVLEPRDGAGPRVREGSLRGPRGRVARPPVPALGRAVARDPVPHRIPRRRRLGPSGSRRSSGEGSSGSSSTSTRPSR